MKRFINIPTVIKVVLDLELNNNVETEVAAATYKGHEIPEGKLPPADKDAIVNSQVWSDYQSFIETVEDFLEYYNLDIYYKNNSDYNSFYWSALAKDDNGNDLFDFTIRLRVSTHPAHRTKQSQQNKKQEKEELAKLAKKKRVNPLPIIITINDKSTKFENYMDAIVYIDTALEHALDIMTRRTH